MPDREVELIVPVGTSLVTSWIRSVDKNLRVPKEWQLLGLSHENGRKPDENAWIAKLRPLLKDPIRTCAEIDSIRKWMRADTVIKQVSLLVSDTEECRWASQVLKSLLPDVVGQNVTVETFPIARLNTDLPMREGLIEFIRVAAKAIKECRGRGRLAVVNATPGFKAETALLTLLAALLRAESFYLHERMSTFVGIPVLPLKWDIPKDDVDILFLLGDAASRDRARSAGLASRPVLAPFVQQVDDIWGVSALGQMLLETLSDSSDIEPADRESRLELKIGIAEHERGHLPNDACDLAKRLWCAFPFVTQVKVAGWRYKKCRQGVIGARQDDDEHGIIRLRLETADDRNGIELINFMLFTTARKDRVRWQAARQKVAAEYGEVSLSDELGEELSMGSTPSSGEIQSILSEDFGALALEQTLERALNQKRGEIEELNSRLNRTEQEFRAVKERHERELEKLKTENNKLRNRLRQSEAEVNSRCIELDSLKAQLAARRAESDNAARSTKQS